MGPRKTPKTRWIRGCKSNRRAIRREYHGESRFTTREGFPPLPGTKVADLSPIFFRKESATDGTKLDLNIGETQGLAALIQGQIYNTVCQ